MPDDLVVEGQQKVDEVPEVKPDADGKHPENVSWSQYVGIKESLGKKLETATKEVSDLKEQAKTTVSTEDHKKVAEELTGTKKLLDDKTTELNTKVEATLSEKRASLVKQGFSEEKVKTLSEEAIDAVLTVEIPKPKPDLGGGGGSGEPPVKGLDKMRGGFETLHPSK